MVEVLVLLAVLVIGVRVNQRRKAQARFAAPHGPPEVSAVSAGRPESHVVAHQHACADCGSYVSPQASVCPTCGRPTGRPVRAICPHCGVAAIGPGRGVQGAEETLTTLLLLCVLLIPGVIYYCSKDNKPYCFSCKRRV